MIAFAFINGDGIPTGGGMRRALPDGAVPLPAPYITLDLARLRYRDGIWEERTDLPEVQPPTAEEIVTWKAEQLTRAKAQAVDRINTRVGDLRRMIYTDIPGQDALYLEKRAEAVAYVAEARRGAEPATLADYPLLESETGITAPTPWQLAQIWLFRSQQFKRVGAATERLRMKAIIAAGTAPDEDTIATLLADLNEALRSLTL